MKIFVKPATLLPILAGAIIGVLLFLLGDAGDAPGLSLIGLAMAFLLILWGVYNAGMIQKGFLMPIILLCFGAGGILLSIVLLLDGEFQESPDMAIVGVALGIVLTAIGIITINKAVQERKRIK